MRDGIEKTVSAILLGASAVFLIVGIAHKSMGTSGIAKIKLELPPQSPRRRELHLPIITRLLPDTTQLPDVTGLSDIATKAESIASNLASRVSDAASQATGAAGSILDNIPREITIRTTQICLIAKDNGINCRDVSPDLSTWFPSPLNAFPGLSSISSPISAMLRVNTQSCLIAALVGVFLLSALRAALSIIDIGTSGILWLILGRKTLVEAVGALLVLVPLSLASVVTFSIPSLLRRVGFLMVEDGDLLWCLGTALVTAVFGIAVQSLPWM
ncbi:hypothetical protein F4809DRAFT_581291 [Biscogniauxia mediterranea]|nr:hypothetical protein F4809DRAFT_581291 [Biscogniauxia mediterranea]